MISPATSNIGEEKRKIFNKNSIDFSKNKIVIFQSDDWGYCGGTPNIEIYNELKDIFVDYFGKKSTVWGKATLECPENMENLFSILEKYTDKRGRHPCFNAAYVVSNPDFRKIKSNNFKNYFDLELPNVSSLWRRGDIIEKAREGIKRGVWYPTYHGRSHFNHYKWMRQLSQNDPVIVKAFQNQVVISDSFEYDKNIPIYKQEENLQIGIKRFKKLFGFAPVSTIAPSYKWQNKTEKLFSKHGMRIIQAKNYQETKRTLSEKIKGKIVNIIGHKSFDKPWQIEIGDYNPHLDVIYLKRNVYFEPEGRKDNNTRHGATGAYRQILKCWKNNEPAIIVTHRVNYINHDNAYVDINLKHLDRLLCLIHSMHPDVNYFQDKELTEFFKTGDLN